MLLLFLYEGVGLGKLSLVIAVGAGWVCSTLGVAGASALAASVAGLGFRGARAAALGFGAAAAICSAGIYLILEHEKSLGRELASALSVVCLVAAYVGGGAVIGAACPRGNGSPD
jgi:hypothetical protein